MILGGAANTTTRRTVGAQSKLRVMLASSEFLTSLNEASNRAKAAGDPGIAPKWRGNENSDRWGCLLESASAMQQCSVSSALCNGT